MAKITEKNLRIVEHFMMQRHFTKNERMFLFMVAMKVEITEKEKQRFDKLVERHKFLLN